MRDHSYETADISGRLAELERLTGTMLPQREPEVIAIPEATRPLIPVPRRSRVFLRHGEGHGSFADLTLTAPVVPHRHRQD
ncbi:hypothetical protein J2X46_002327 [Nocardioides sp. BE266]|uniref:hypothetical protein n=1 Tax=Nocardioides sp. BE266 TaxID=2817725 RepID=UPI0028565F30|nr:hypothetical protein [Nocardioides sp. BE266]MDR7253342.1 hypothetical protein [Nocardioides sp. BE266]